MKHTLMEKLATPSSSTVTASTESGSSQSHSMIHTEKLNRIFRTDSLETQAVRNVDITIEAGEFVAIMGPSGCGKSTLLHILGLLDVPDSGSYFLKGQAVHRWKETDRLFFRRKEIGMIFQQFNLIDEYSIYENVELPLAYLRVPPRERKIRIREILDYLKISHRRNHKPQQLSGGQQQRAAIARALVAQPSLILADEPTGNLDTQNSLEVMKLLTELNRQGKTIVMVTHSQHDAAFAHRIINMLDGEISYKL